MAVLALISYYCSHMPIVFSDSLTIYRQYCKDTWI